MEKSEKIEKSVKIRDTVYRVKIEADRLEVSETVYPLPGAGNHVETGLELTLNHSKRYSLIEAWESADNWNGTYSKMADRRFLAKADAKSKYDAIKQRLIEAEQDTPDVKDVHEYAEQQLIPELAASRLQE